MEPSAAQVHDMQPAASPVPGLTPLGPAPAGGFADAGTLERNSPLAPFSQEAAYSPVAAVPANNPYASPASKQKKHPSRDGGGFFGPEKHGLQKGVMGGLIMIAISVVWFFGGLAMGVLFYYPPILFIIGAVGVVRGLATGNMTGRQ